MKKLILMISLVVLFVNLGIAQNKHSIQNMTFNLPNDAIKIDIPTFDSNSIAYRLTNSRNIYKTNEIYLGIKDLEIGNIPVGILDTIKKVQEGLAEDLADIQQTTSEILTINSNKVFIFYNKLGNSQGYYFVVLKSDNEQIFGGRLVFEGQSNYAAATTILYNFLNSVTFPYVNTPQTGSFTKNDCGAGNDTFGRDESYTITAGTCTSAISQADADSQAQAVLKVEGQKNANLKGTCK